MMDNIIERILAANQEAYKHEMEAIWLLKKEERE